MKLTLPCLSPSWLMLTFRGVATMDSLDVVQKKLMDIIHDVGGPHVGMPRCSS